MKYARWMVVVLIGVGLRAQAIPVEWRIADGGNGHYYEYVPDLRPWSDAATAADGAGYGGADGHLVTITSAAENDFLSDYLLNLSGAGREIWIGLTDSETYGGTESSGQPNPAVDGWVWVTGEPVAFTFWHSGQPDDWAGGEDFGLIDTAYGNTRWNDGKDYWTCPYVVEYESPSAVPDRGSAAGLLGLGIAVLAAAKRRQGLAC
ncbi:MAG: VPDSG-CTERM sorting domain-containing protein [Lentisphaerae bacterium]|nr:VPDSG-CTERM sorting domain-containing protein [Lentisphaerota bacterium]